MIASNKNKNIIKLLSTILMMLFSKSIFAGIGDVYYCEMTQFTGIKDH